MPFNIIIKEEALSEALEAYLYYEEQQEGLGDNFVRTLLHCYEQITQNPQYYSYISTKKVKTLRDVKIKGFPYVVIFDFVDSEVTVFSVHNSYKAPKKF
jgi:mRNA-degrading endonuclease RelE of RelBE toxin-antitoxin system